VSNAENEALGQQRRDQNIREEGRAQMEQALVNIFKNALEAMEAGASLSTAMHVSLFHKPKATVKRLAIPLSSGKADESFPADTNLRHTANAPGQRESHDPVPGQWQSIPR